MKTCFLFPGQGAQYPGMGKDLWENSAKVKDLFATVSEITGKDMKSLLFEGSVEDLKATDNTQLAITLVNVSTSIVLKEKSAREVLVEELMTKEIYCVTPDKPVEECMGVMTTARCRHMPVFENKRLIGNLILSKAQSESGLKKSRLRAKMTSQMNTVDSTKQEDQ